MQWGFQWMPSPFLICKGLSVRDAEAEARAHRSDVYFGGFQMLMPLIGFALGVRFQSFITSIDHWIAFVLLGLIGANMIRESREQDEENLSDSFSLRDAMLPLAVATSIDALAVGVTFAFLQVSILPAVSLYRRDDLYSVVHRHSDRPCVRA